eukprot:2630841-Prymnesium_polylepis.2
MLLVVAAALGLATEHEEEDHSAQVVLSVVSVLAGIRVMRVLLLSTTYGPLVLMIVESTLPGLEPPAIGPF